MTSRATGTLFCDLNADVIFDILSNLRPVDIVNVRRTCKILCLATKHRLIWLKALSEVIQENSLFKGTYHSNSMSTVELERAALFPSVIRSLSRGSKESLRRLSQRVLLQSYEEDEITSRNLLAESGTTKDVSDITLVPGGRFLFTTSAGQPYSKAYVNLWELGQPGNGEFKITLLARLVGKFLFKILATAPTSDGLGIRIVIAEELQADNTLRVYHIFPSSSKPTFEEVAYSKATNCVCSMGISGNRIICSTITDRPGPDLYSNEGHILIWDYVKKISATLQPKGRVPQNLYLYEDRVISFEKNILTTWAIPPLLPGAPDYSYDHSPSASVWSQSLPYSDSLSSESVHHIRMEAHDFGWTSNTNVQQYFVCPNYKTYSGGSTHSKQCTIFQLDESFNSDLPLSSPHFQARFKIPSSGWGPLVPQICDQNIVFTYSSTAGYIALVYVPIPDKTEGRIVEAEMCTLQTGKINKVQFCAATGRGCALSEDGEVRILDYE